MAEELNLTESKQSKTDFTPEISIIIPAFHEEKVISEQLSLFWFRGRHSGQVYLPTEIQKMLEGLGGVRIQLV